jgi:hypothetical protein
MVKICVNLSTCFVKRDRPSWHLTTEGEAPIIKQLQYERADCPKGEPGQLDLFDPDGLAWETTPLPFS